MRLNASQTAREREGTESEAFKKQKVEKVNERAHTVSRLRSAEEKGTVPFLKKATCKTIFKTL